MINLNILKISKAILGLTLPGSILAPLSNANLNEEEHITYSNKIENSFDTFEAAFKDVDLSSFITEFIDNENYLNEFPVVTTGEAPTLTSGEIEGYTYVYYLATIKTLKMELESKSVDDLRNYLDFFAVTRSCITDTLYSLFYSEDCAMAAGNLNTLFTDFNTELPNLFPDRDGFSSNTFYISLKQDLLDGINSASSHTDTTIDPILSMIDLEKVILNFANRPTDKVEEYYNEWLFDERAKSSHSFDHILSSSPSYMINKLTEEQMNQIHLKYEIVTTPAWEELDIENKKNAILDYFSVDTNTLINTIASYNELLIDKYTVYALSEAFSVINSIYKYNSINFESIVTFYNEMLSPIYQFIDCLDALNSNDYVNYIYLVENTHFDLNQAALNILSDFTTNDVNEEMARNGARYRTLLEIYERHNDLWNEGVYDKDVLNHITSYTSLLEGAGTQEVIDLIKFLEAQEYKKEEVIVPQLRINSSTNMWEVSYDKGTTWTLLNVKATGDKGNTGEQGEIGPTGPVGPQGDSIIPEKDNMPTIIAIISMVIALASLATTFIVTKRKKA